MTVINICDIFSTHDRLIKYFEHMLWNVAVRSFVVSRAMYGCHKLSLSFRLNTIVTINLRLLPTLNRRKKHSDDDDDEN